MSITRSSSAARSAWRAVPARGFARTTSRLPAGSDSMPSAHQLAQPPAHLVPHHRATHRAAHDEPGPGGPSRRPAAPAGARSAGSARSGCRPARRRRNPRAAGSGLLREARVTSAVRARAGESDTDPRAALAPPRGQDGAAGPGPHAQPEPVRLGAPSVVRLERTLAHRKLQVPFWACPARASKRACGHDHVEVVGSAHVTRPAGHGSNRGWPPGSGNTAVCSPPPSHGA